MELILATQNVHKIRELRDMLKSFKEVAHLDILSLLNFPDYEALPEEGLSFKENVERKALHAAKKLGKWVLADDSGLVIPALKGAPGIYSARYSGLEATDGENRQKLLAEMHGLEDIERTGYFECWLSLASAEGIKKSVHATCEGLIINQERGRHGFGYDPLFIKHDYDKTFAELDEQTKNRISHRRKAIEKLIPSLEMLRDC
ncbi:Non-canonical purine NTP pyrophosphatase [Neochlamydia sp. EPS4]|jgi:XTP/dITP diphosphohydrolase|uniref:RdgB/HAM1 family non-canonical purine NTP pyrophosphatase n=1 Tax=unclassified Neochlamydia TaxID=2643326 RepID=UPI00057DCBAD|nr:MULTISPECIES: RdgB/HAM1 family non-canonical purine NTP pyrophosphatase [unclassified Neochlamydia]KIC72033.1 Non-canonical purine NTP pyrophosphatase [Neochlamydia sp. TUME1]KIC75630.1 Non-canonical purine NTP pyrophosphatase [Neochlamydia sp. EPS4]BBI17996.1 deoxyribonucleotide triphosphate pyrophosphatase [Neochlamydia sp. S13]